MVVFSLCLPLLLVWPQAGSFPDCLLPFLAEVCVPVRARRQEHDVQDDDEGAEQAGADHAG